jgi:hypothetical protein
MTELIEHFSSWSIFVAYWYCRNRERDYKCIWGCGSVCSRKVSRKSPRKGPYMYWHYDTHLQLQKSKQATFWREVALLQTSGVVFTLDVPLYTANTRQLVVAYLVLGKALVATSA